MDNSAFVVFKPAWQAAISRNPRNIPEPVLAKRLGAGINTLRQYGDVNKDKLPPLRLFYELQKASGSREPIQSLCLMLGGNFIPLEPIDGDHLDEHIKAFKTLTSFLEKVALSYKDHQIDDKELRKINLAGLEAIAIINNIMAKAAENNLSIQKEWEE